VRVESVEVSVEDEDESGEVGSLVAVGEVEVLVLVE